MKANDMIPGNVYTLEAGQHELWVFIPTVYGPQDIKELVRMNVSLFGDLSAVYHDTEGFFLRDEHFTNEYTLRPATQLERDWYAHRFQSDPVGSPEYLYKIQPLKPIVHSFKFLP